jgi:glycerol 2-dehydrogenase (NADP+)
MQLPTLDEDDLHQIDSLDRNQRVCNIPDENGMVMGWSIDKLGW